MNIYNRQLVKLLREKAVTNKEFKDVSYFYHHGQEIILGLIEDLDLKKIKRILIYGQRGIYPIHAILNLLKNIIIEYQFYEPSLHQASQYDLIISFFDLNTIDDLQLFLFQAKKQLTENGVFVGCFIGEESLMKSRKILWQVEEKLLQKCYARIWPMIRLMDMTSLLQNSGFSNVISFKEQLMRTYPSFLGCLKEIKLMGENGSLAQQEYFPKNLYKFLQEHYSDEFEETFEIIAFCATQNANSFASVI